MDETKAHVAAAQSVLKDVRRIWAEQAAVVRAAKEAKKEKDFKDRKEGKAKPAAKPKATKS